MGTVGFWLTLISVELYITYPTALTGFVEIRIPRLVEFPPPPSPTRWVLLAEVSPEKLKDVYDLPGCCGRPASFRDPFGDFLFLVRTPEAFDGLFWSGEAHGDFFGAKEKGWKFVRRHPIFRGKETI